MHDAQFQNRGQRLLGLAFLSCVVPPGGPVEPAHFNIRWQTC